MVICGKNIHEYNNEHIYVILKNKRMMQKSLIDHVFKYLISYDIILCH